MMRGDRNTAEGVLEELDRRRRNLLAGGTNCIPLPFPRFRREFPGTEQGRYVLVTANQKVGKTQLADFTFVFGTLDYAFASPGKCSVHIIYFSLEESVQKIIERYMCHLLYVLDGIRIAPADLRSVSEGRPVPERVLELLRSDRYRERLDFFGRCVDFRAGRASPDDIFSACEEYALSVGERVTESRESSGSFRTEERTVSYGPHDPNHYMMLVIDHIGLVERGPGMRLKDAVDRTSENCVRLRNDYGFTCVAVQQQASETEGLDAVKAGRTVPSAAGLSDSKYPARDADIVLGLFDPSRYGFPAWLGYRIRDEQGTWLGGCARFLYVLANRNGNTGGICPLFFDGAACVFEEMPRPDDAEGIAGYYARARELLKGSF